MKNTVLFVLLDLYAEWEGAYLSSFINYIDPEKYEAKTVSLTKEPIHSIGGFTLLPDYDIDSAPSDFAALILIGGMSWREESARKVEPLVQAALSQNKIVGGICDASVFLGKMGVLNNISHTSNSLADLQAGAGDAYTGAAHYKDQQAARDHNIITANGTASLEFTEEVLIALAIAPEKTIQEWCNFYKKGACHAPMPKF